MSADDSMWVDRAQSAEARLSTMEQAHKAAVERIRNFKANFGVRERDNGEIVIDYDKFVERLGVAGALELRAIIDAKYSITGDPGKKPHMKVVAG